MKFLNYLSTSLSALLVLGVVAAIAAPDGIIRQSVAICDPYYPTNCMQPTPGGELPVQVTFPTPLPVVIQPLPDSTNSIDYISTTSASSSLTLISGNHGSLYGFQVTSGATPGYVMVFNAPSAPADGAVTPARCYVLAANSTLGIDYRSGPPPYFFNGITIVFSSTGCFNKTASATAFISGDAQ